MNQRDIDELERLMDDPVKNHTEIMQRLQPTLPSIIYKDFVGKQPALDSNGNNNDLPPMSSDEMIDAMAQALAQTRDDLRAEFQDTLDAAMAPWTEAVAVLQAQMNIVLSLIANNNNNGNGTKSIEADEVRTTRRVRVRRTSESKT